MGLRNRLKKGLHRAVDAVFGDEEDDFMYAVSPETVSEAEEPQKGETTPTDAESTVEAPSVDADETPSADPEAPAADEEEAYEPASEADRERLYAHVVDAIQQVYDPEIPVNIYELGLIYDVEVREDRMVDVNMTLTSPNCPAAQILPAEVEMRASGVDGIRGAVVAVVWDPPWEPNMMSEAAKLELNML